MKAKAKRKATRKKNDRLNVLFSRTFSGEDLMNGTFVEVLERSGLYEEDMRSVPPKGMVRPTNQEVLLLAMHGFPKDLTRVFLRFHPGRISMSPVARDALQRSGESEGMLLERHLRGDWGNVPAELQEQNDQNVNTERPVMSSYRTPRGEVVNVTTEVYEGQLHTAIYAPYEA